MKQIVIDRYNKAQNKIKASINPVDYIDLSWGPSVLDGECIPIYEFFNNPEYGWRETFDKDPDYQREFWQWMEDKKYGISRTGVLITDWYRGEMLIPTHPQMLTGYIAEFMEQYVQL